MADTIAVLAPQRTGKRRKIVPEDVQHIAELVANRLTESEACAVLQIDREVWYHWKARHAEQFEQLLARVRGSQIQAHMENIKSFEPKDWRASAQLLKFKAPERFGDRAGEANAAVTVNVLALPGVQRALERIYSQPAQDISCVSDTPTGGVLPERAESQTPQSAQVIDCKDNPS